MSKRIGASPIIPPRTARFIVSLIITVFLSVVSNNTGQCDEPQPENLALSSSITVSSTRDTYVKENAVDGNPDTSWSTALGAVSGQWMKFDWTEPHQVSSVIMHQTGLYINAVSVQVDQDGKWVTVDTVGFANQRPPLVIVSQFNPVSTKSMRLSFESGAAFTEVGIFNDPNTVQKIADEANKLDIAVAGDSRGNMMGTVSTGQGTIAIQDAEAVIEGKNSSGSWKKIARTDVNGYFATPIPPGTMGDINIAVKKDKQIGKSVVDCSDLALSLTPRASDRSAKRIPLQGKWDFAVDPPKDYPSQPISAWSKIKVPAHWEMEGFSSRSGKAVYRRTFAIPGSWARKRVKFRAEAIYSHAEVFVNGKRVGSHEGGVTPFEFDITDATRPGVENEIVILVDARSAASNLDHYSFFSYFELAGIWRSIEVFCVEPAHISRLAVSTTFDKDYRDADLTVDVDIVNEQSEPIKDARLSLTLRDPKGKWMDVEGLSAQFSIGAWERKTITLRAKVANPERWTAETPILYTLTSTLNGSGKVVQPFGFRQVEIKGRVFTINGKPTKMWGISRLEAHPLEGRALSRKTIKQDMEMIKASNANAIRMTICPPDPYTLDLSDQLGMYVEDEGAYCWASAEASDLRFAPMIMGISNQYFERDRNHPSVVQWSLCNESSFGRCFQMTHDMIRKSDPSRPTSAGQSANTEIATYHNPTSRQRMLDTADMQMPVYFDEGMAAFHGWGMADMMELDPGLRDFWVTGPIDSVAGILESDHFMGVQLFSWVDDNFCVPDKGVSLSRRGDNRIEYMDRVYKLPGRGIVGDYVWGIIDGWRRPKPEYWLTKKLYSPIVIEERPVTLPESGEPISVGITNRNVYTNLRQYLCKWSIGDESSELRVDVEPSSSGRLTIAPKRQPQADDILLLRFFDAKGGLVDGYKLAFKPIEAPAFPNSGKPAEIVVDPERTDTGWLSSRYLEQSQLVRLLGRNTEIALDRTTGLLMRGLIDNEIALYSGFSLHFMTSSLPEQASPLMPYPTGWRFTGSQWRTENGKAVIDWNGAYGENFIGRFTYRIDDDGDFEVEYSFKNNGPEFIVREAGLSFEVPLSFDRLEWDRRAEWSYYPDDHIGRPHGVTIAHPNIRQTIPAGKSRPYSLDDHPWGSNDFRSAKRNINWAALTDAQGYGVKVFSDGSQTVRATVGVHSISVKVLDYYGGSPSQIQEYSGLYGLGRTIKTGDIVHGIVRLRLFSNKR
ncbi:MAG: glycoside hydrolase family 2 TIM barrel-domain containing protein [Armatimonadota bacterium]